MNLRVSLLLQPFKWEPITVVDIKGRMYYLLLLKKLFNIIFYHIYKIEIRRNLKICNAFYFSFLKIFCCDNFKHMHKSKEKEE